MSLWVLYSLIAAALYGVTGLLQKLASNRVPASVSVVTCAFGYIVALPYLLATCGPFSAASLYIFIAVCVGITSQLGTWYLFACLENGAKASVAVPLTALYPLITILLARVFLTERLNRLQCVGVTLALIGGALLSSETPEAATKEVR